MGSRVEGTRGWGNRRGKFPQSPGLDVIARPRIHRLDGCGCDERGHPTAAGSGNRPFRLQPTCFDAHQARRPDRLPPTWPFTSLPRPPAPRHSRRPLFRRGAGRCGDFQLVRSRGTPESHAATRSRTQKARPARRSGRLREWAIRSKDDAGKGQVLRSERRGVIHAPVSCVTIVNDTAAICRLHTSPYVTDLYFLLFLRPMTAQSSRVSIS